MLHHALLFLVVALIAGVLVLGFISGTAALMAKSCFRARSKGGKL